MEKCKLICKFRFTNIDKNGWGGGEVELNQKEGKIYEYFKITGVI
jgi:hypothetical protein